MYGFVAATKNMFHEVARHWAMEAGPEQMVRVMSLPAMGHYPNHAGYC